MRNEINGEEFLRRLSTLLDEIGVEPTLIDGSEEKTLDAYEKFAKVSSNRSRWILLFDRFSWLGTAWLAENRFYRQIKWVRELGTSIGWQANATLDALRELDDLAFARTYGARVPPAIKAIVREIAKKELLAPYELRNVVRNHMIKQDQRGRVIVSEHKWLLPAAIFMFLFMSLVVCFFFLLFYVAPAPSLAKGIGFSLVAAVYWSCCAFISSFLVIPYRLAPRVKKALPVLSLLR